MHSVISDALAFLMIMGVFAVVASPFWAPLLFYTISAIHDMQRERLIERREREEREARIRAYNAMAQQAQQPTLPAPPYYAPLPPPQPQPWVVEQPQRAPRTSITHAVGRWLDGDK